MNRADARAFRYQQTRKTLARAVFLALVPAVPHDAEDEADATEEANNAAKRAFALPDAFLERAALESGFEANS